MDTIILHITILLLAITCNVGPQEKCSWQLELLPGIVMVPPMPFNTYQTNHQNLSTNPHYCSYRLSSSKHNKGWNMEMNHQKPDLKNTSSAIELFNDYPGYNQFCLNRAYTKDHIPIIDGHALEPIIAFLLLSSTEGKL